MCASHGRREEHWMLYSLEYGWPSVQCPGRPGLTQGDRQQELDDKPHAVVKALSPLYLPPLTPPRASTQWVLN